MSAADGAKLQEVQTEIDAVAKQIKRVEFNSNAVEAAIAGHGTYRGYSGEDVFLKNNLSVVQKEMMKQLKRKERSLTHQKQKLQTKLGIVRPTSPAPQQPASTTDDPVKGDATAGSTSSKGETGPPPPPPRKTAATLPASVSTRLPVSSVVEEYTGRTRKRNPEASQSASRMNLPQAPAGLEAEAPARSTSTPKEVAPSTLVKEGLPSTPATSPAEVAAALPDAGASPARAGTSPPKAPAEPRQASAAPRGVTPEPPESAGSPPGVFSLLPGITGSQHEAGATRSGIGVSHPKAAAATPEVAASSSKANVAPPEDAVPRHGASISPPEADAAPSNAGPTPCGDTTATQPKTAAAPREVSEPQPEVREPPPEVTGSSSETASSATVVAAPPSTAVASPATSASLAVPGAKITTEMAGKSDASTKSTTDTAVELSGTAMVVDGNGEDGAAVLPAGKNKSTEVNGEASGSTLAANQEARENSTPGNLGLSNTEGGRGVGGGAQSSKKKTAKSASPANDRNGGAAATTSARKKADKRRDFYAPPSPRVFKSPRRGSHVPGPAHSVAEYLANTNRGKEAVASIKVGTVFWIKFSDTKEAWLECGVVEKVYPRSAVPYEVNWRPFDSYGGPLALNPKKRIALTPRLFVTGSDHVKATEEKVGGPPAGTEGRDGFEPSSKELMLNVPPIGSWCIVKPDQPWGELRPFAF